MEETFELSSMDEQELLRKRVGEVGAERDGEELSKQRNSICRDPKAGEGTQHLEDQRAYQQTANRPVAGDKREST